MAPSQHHRAVPRVLRRHRRVAAALLVGLAGAAAVHAAAPRPDGVAVAVAARDLAAGERLDVDDLATALLPPGSVPDGALAADDLLGAQPASAVRRGEPLTDVRLRGPGAASALPAGRVAVPVRLAPEAAPWLTVGQRLRLHAAPVPGTTLLPGERTASTGVPVLLVDLVDLVDEADEAGGLLAPAATDRAAVEALVQVADDDAAGLVAVSGEPLRAVLLGP